MACLKGKSFPLGATLLQCQLELRRRGSDGSFDWTLVEEHADLHRFVKELIALCMNQSLPVERLDMTLTELLRRQPIQWHGVKLNAPDWGHESHTPAGTVRLFGYPLLLHFNINAYWEALEFEIPALGEAQESWRRCVDTSLNPPDDISGWTDAQRLQSSSCPVQPRSVVLLGAALTTQAGQMKPNLC